MSMTQADPPLSTAEDVSDTLATSSGGSTSPPRRRWQVWRSPADQPWWARPALLVIAAVTGLLFASMLRNAGYAPLYSVAVKSMSMSWKAFFYGAIDPGATATLDKLAGSFLPQALSARIFGYHPWSLALPQVIEGVIAVLVMYRVVRRWSGEVAGLLAAGILGLTPVVTSMFGHGMEDGALTMCLVLAVDCYQRAVNEGRFRSLLFAGVWVGVGFQCKMLQAWMILPPLAVGYLVLAPTTLRRRLLHLVTAGAVMVAVSASWILLYTVTPAADRPYVAGTTDNSAFTMVVGFNGLERFGIRMPGTELDSERQSPARDSGPRGNQNGGPNVAGDGGPPGGPGSGPNVGGNGGPPGGPGSGPNVGGDGGPPPSGDPLPPPPGDGGPDEGANGPSLTSRTDSWTKLVAEPDFATQTGWLYPLAVLSLVWGLWWHRRAGRTDTLRGGFLMWGVWLVTAGLVFTMVSIPHIAYLATLSIPLAALAGGGIVLLWRAHLAGGVRAWALPAVMVAEIAWTIYLSAGYRDFLPWLAPLVGLVGGLAVAVMVLGLVTPAVRGRVVMGALAAGVGAMLLTPSAWAASVVDFRYSGNAGDAGAGPTAQPGGAKPSYALTDEQRRLLDYTRSHGNGATYVFATNSWNTASTYIAGAGARVLPLGGFSGATPSPTLAETKALVHTGKLRFVLITGDRGFGGAPVSATVSQVTSWVESTCTKVPASTYGGTDQPDASNQGFANGSPPAAGQTLYECTKG